MIAVDSNQLNVFVLRLQPSAIHPNGQILSLPASKFNEFGSANLVLDNGQKVSVRIKHESKKDRDREEAVSHLSNFFHIDDGKETNSEEEIPITILRDGKTGEPIMALPGLKPKKEFVLHENKEKQFPVVNSPANTAPVPSPPLPPPPLPTPPLPTPPLPTPPFPTPPLPTPLFPTASNELSTHRLTRDPQFLQLWQLFREV